MTDQQLNEIEARANAATPGPWEDLMQMGKLFGGPKMQIHICDIRGWGYLTGIGGLSLPHEKAVAIQEANGAFIAHARADVPTLTAEIRRIWKMERIRLECNNRDLERRREAEHTAELLRRENAALNRRILRLEAALKVFADDDNWEVSLVEGEEFDLDEDFKAGLFVLPGVSPDMPDAGEPWKIAQAALGDING